MILIISKDYDPSTEEVINWIDYLGGKFIRKNNSEFLENEFSLRISKRDKLEFKSNYKNKRYSSNEIGSIWYRRLVPYRTIENKIFQSNIINKKTKDRLYASLNNEYYYSTRALFECLRDKFWLSSPENSILDKIRVLDIAKKCSIEIPETLLTNNKKELIRFIENKEKIITKSINNISFLTVNGINFNPYTSFLTREDLNNVGDKFPPSLFQEYVQKEIEIRSFFLNGQFYSMAIFSQSDLQTEIDFRKYNKSKPNRTIPFLIPQKTEKKLKKLMDFLELNTGSIDLIKTVNNRFVFLEVNPVGQFGMVSYPCNYFLEKKIAKCLIDEDKRNG